MKVIEGRIETKGLGCCLDSMIDKDKSFVYFFVKSNLQVKVVNNEMPSNLGRDVNTDSYKSFGNDGFYSKFISVEGLLTLSSYHVRLEFDDDNSIYFIDGKASSERKSNRKKFTVFHEVYSITIID